MRLRTEALLISAALWFVIIALVTGRVNGLSLLGFYPLLLRMMRDEMKTLRRNEKWN